MYCGGLSPVLVTSGMGTYPSQADEDAAYASSSARRYYLPAIDLAKALGNARVNNVVMLGALSALLDVPEAAWLGVIANRVPTRFVEINKRAFAEGRREMQERLELVGAGAS